MRGNIHFDVLGLKVSYSFHQCPIFPYFLALAKGFDNETGKDEQLQ